nr:hypothetical protein CFP56_50856 [Quercus suber]
MLSIPMQRPLGEGGGQDSRLKTQQHDCHDESLSAFSWQRRFLQLSLSKYDISSRRKKVLYIRVTRTRSARLSKQAVEQGFSLYALSSKRYIRWVCSGDWHDWPNMYRPGGCHAPASGLG